ncbi:MAG: hypothetical protein IJ439_05630 [Tyzzerella sp.]|nr:hypothetical protein [Tyzzerella sp.]
MASQYKNLRCPGCDGTLEYNKEKKVWVCIYCGNEIRREEEYDGLYTIKNVVKQVLVDLAYGRMDSAQKNLIECEKIASDYIGTVIASICYKVFTIITPGACQQSEVKGLFGQIKRLYQQFVSMDSGISAEEEALYEAFEGNSDAFGVLILVYDSLKAKEHLDFVNEFFDASTVYSISLNANLLNYALRNDLSELTDKIFANSDNINCRESLIILLDAYQDCQKKRDYMETLFSKSEFRTEDYKLMDKYIAETSDGIDTKVVLYSNAVKYHISPSIQTVMMNILSDEHITDEQIAIVIRAFGDTHPKDAELYEFIEQVYTKHSGRTANMEFQVLMDCGLFIKPTEKCLRFMVNRQDWSISERSSMLEKSMKCNLDNRAKDSVLAEILLHNGEDTESRIILINKALEYVDTISTNALTDYILKCNLDGERKPEVLRMFLKLDLNMSFFRDVLSRYMQGSIDQAETKKEIIQELSNCGLQMDFKVLLDMACRATEANYMEVVSTLQRAIKNGTRISSDAVSTYLENVKPENYCGELISLLHTSMSRISDKALANYVLYATESFDIKLKNSVEFAGQNPSRFGSSMCGIKYLNSDIQCNLLQAYVLKAEDSVAIVEAMVTAMKNAGTKLNDSIIVNGVSMRFKKYVMDCKAQLSQMTLAILEENKVFSIFFN